MSAVIKLSVGEIKKNAGRFVLIFICAALAVAPVVMVYTYLSAFAEIQYLINVDDILSNSAAIDTAVEVLAKNGTYYLIKAIGLFFTVLVSFIAFVSIRNVMLNEYGKRAKTLGLLESQGATVRQKAVYLTFNGLLLSFISDPCGVALGYAVIIPMIKAQSDLCSAYLGIPALSILNGVKVRDLIIVISGVLVVILFSAVQPALRTVRLRESVLEKLICNRFGAPGRLAFCNYTNNKRQHIHFSIAVSSIISLFMMIRLFGVYLTQEVSFEKRGLEELNNGIVAIALILMLAVFLVVFVSTISSMLVSFDKRKPEFAMLRSLGMSGKQLACMIILESALQSVYTFIFSFTGTLAGDFILFKLVSSAWNKVTFLFPFFESVLIITAVSILLALMSVIMFITYRKVSIVSEIKSAF